MKFLVPNYSCLQNPWLGGYRPQIPVLSVLCPQLNLLNPPPQTKFLGTPLYRGIRIIAPFFIKQRIIQRVFSVSWCVYFVPGDRAFSNHQTEEDGWAPQPLWIFWRKERFLASLMNWILNRPFYSLVTQWTSLSWHLVKTEIFESWAWKVYRSTDFQIVVLTSSSFSCSGHFCALADTVVVESLFFQWSQMSILRTSWRQ